MRSFHFLTILNLLILVMPLGAQPSALKLCAEWTKSLSPQNRKNLLRPPTEETSTWHFLPLSDPRHPSRLPNGELRGLSFKSMDSSEMAQLEELLRSIFGQALLFEFTTIRQLDQYLRDQGIPQRADSRFKNENYGMTSYMASIHGTLEPYGQWSLQVQGHHFSATLHFYGDELLSSGPLFLGAWPRSQVILKSDSTTIDRFDAIHVEMIQHLEPWIIRPMVPPMSRPLRNQVGPEVNRLERLYPLGLSIHQLDEANQARLRSMIQLYLELVPQKIRGVFENQTKNSSDIYIRAGGGLSYQKVAKSILIQVAPESPHGFVIEWVAIDASGQHIHSLWRPNHH